MRSRRWPTLPRSLERSTIGAVGLNDRVRNGNGCGPYALVASEIGDKRRRGRSLFQKNQLQIVLALLAVLLASHWE